MAQWGPHIKRAARLAFEQHIVATQMDLSSLTGRPQLLQVTVAKLSLFVFLVANGLRICYALGDRRRSYSGSAITCRRICSCHLFWTRVENRIVHELRPRITQLTRDKESHRHDLAITARKDTSLEHARFERTLHSDCRRNHLQ